MSASNPTPRTEVITLPPYITEVPVSAKRSRIAEILGATEILVQRGVPIEVRAIARVLDEHGRGFTNSGDASKIASRVLYRTGWMPVRYGTKRSYIWERAEHPGEHVMSSIPEPYRFPDLEVHSAVDAKVTPIKQGSSFGPGATAHEHVVTVVRGEIVSIEPAPAAQVEKPVEFVPTPEQIHELHTTLEKAAANEPLTVSDPEDDVAEQLLREAETSIEEYKTLLLARDSQLADASEQVATWERTAKAKDREIERLQGLLARERSAPSVTDDGSWTVPIANFAVEGMDVTQVPTKTFEMAGLEVLLTLRPKR